MQFNTHKPNLIWNNVQAQIEPSLPILQNDEIRQVWLDQTKASHSVELVDCLYQKMLSYLESNLPKDNPILIEEWRSAAQIGLSKYEVSNYGKVRNVKSNKMLKPSKDKAGYYYYSLKFDNNRNVRKFRYTLVALLFVPNPDNKPSVDHINRVRDDDRSVNLRWATKREQALNRKERVPMTYPVYQMNSDHKIIHRWESIILAAKTLGITIKTLQNACRDHRLTKQDNYWYYCYEIDLIIGEEWRIVPYPEYEELYASSHGRIKRANGKITYGNKAGGYMKINATTIDKTRKIHLNVHILIASAFYGRHNNLIVNHKDGNKTNNNSTNLEFITARENTQHAIRTGLIKSCKPVIQMDLDGNEIARFPSISEAKRNTGITTIDKAVSGKQPTAGGYKWKRV